jgi:hypothetical protein|tara:strand:- start:18448 stop:18834 length:387 start_codon:yes stop_codon:yes gene_type:complete
METVNEIKRDKKISSLYIDSDGVLVTKVDKALISLDELDNNFIKIKSITKGNAVYGIIDIEQNGDLGKNYLSYLEREYSKVYRALAIITPSKWKRLKSQVTRNFSKSKYPVKLFSNTDQAKKWLKDFL